MRIAVLSDIHGNLLAFEAALAHARRQGFDQLVIAGDIVVGSPDTAACWQLARSLGCPIVRGNHERYVADLGSERAEPLWATPQFTPVQWAAGQLTDAERAAVGALPLALRLPEAPDLVIVHASLRSDTDSLRAHTPDAALPELFPGELEPPMARRAEASSLIVRGHNHIAATRLWGGRTIVTAGSVGMPLDGNTTAQYLLLERRPAGWQISHQAVPYDHDAAVERFYSSGYLTATGPMGRLVLRELLTASFQLVPFLRHYQRLRAVEPIGLEAALERFMSI
jgi:predicted phosphodiesterase